MPNTILIQDEKVKRIISSFSFPLVVAEISANHEGSIERAIELIHKAKECGVDAVKFQTYTPDTMTLPNLYKIEDKKSLWRGYDLYDLYKKAQTPYSWFKRLFKEARYAKLIPFSTPFDKDAVDFLEKEVNPPLYKIASFENNHLPLIRKVARTGKPVVISTGMASLADIENMKNAVYECGNDNLVLLKCTSSYPSSVRFSNIKTIPHLRDMLDVNVGLSDHTLSSAVAIASVALGCCLIEKHFVLSRDSESADAKFSVVPEEMSKLVQEVREASHSLGKVHYGMSLNEKSSVTFRRSFYTRRHIQKGEKFSDENIIALRPEKGVSVKHADVVFMSRAKREIKMNAPIEWKDVEK